MEHLGGGVDVGGGVLVFEAVGEADFFGRKRDDVDGNGVAGGGGLMDEGGVGGGGDDGHVLTTCGEKASDFGQWD